MRAPICCPLNAKLDVAEAGLGSSLNYLEAVRVRVDVEVLDGDLGIVAHQLSTVGAG